MKTIIILGASGFIGGNLLRELSSNKGYDVKGCSSKDCDLLSLESLNMALSSATEDDVVIMAAAIPRRKEDSFDAMMKNIIMAENMSNFQKEFVIEYNSRKDVERDGF